MTNSTIMIKYIPTMLSYYTVYNIQLKAPL